MRKFQRFQRSKIDGDNKSDVHRWTPRLSSESSARRRRRVTATDRKRRGALHECQEGRLVADRQVEPQRKAVAWLEEV